MILTATSYQRRRPALWLLLASFLFWSGPIATQTPSGSGYKINVRGADLGQFITQIAGLTGKTFVIDPRVRGTVTVISDASMDKNEIYELMLSVLRVNGFTAVPAGEIVKIVPHLLGKQTDDGFTQDRGGVPLEQERILTRVIQVHNIQPTAIVPILRPLIPDYSHVATIPNSDLLIINDHQSNLERLERLIKEMDAVEENVVRLLELKEAGVDVMLTLLQRLAPDVLSDSSDQPRQVRIIANDKNNSLLIRGKSSAVEEVAALVAQLDQSTNATSDSATFRLAHADAEDIAELITSLMGGQSQPAEGGGAGAVDFNIQADQSLNAVIVRADPVQMASVKSLIKSLDVRRTQVLIEAAIAEVSMTNDLDVGGAFGIGTNAGNATVPLVSTANTSRSGTALGNVLFNVLSGTAVADGITPVDILSAAGAATSPIVGAFKLPVNGFSFAGLVQALAQNENANLLSTPSILTLDNQEAEIIVGQTVPFRTGTYNTSDRGVDPFVLIERQDIGITLKVTPKINDDGVVQLDVFQEISNISEQQAIGPTAASDLITNKRMISTSVLADDGQTIVLGGLIQNDQRKVQTKVPFFGDIPILGLLFRHNSVRTVKRNLLVFLRPTVLRTPEDVAQATHIKYQGLREILIKSRLSGISKKKLKKVLTENAKSFAEQAPSEESLSPFYEGKLPAEQLPLKE